MQGGRFGEARLRPHTIVESPDSVGLSAKEPMNLVDKRLDKATAPRLLWVHSRRVRTISGSGHVRCTPESGSEIRRIASAAVDLCELKVSPRTCHHRLPRNAERSPFPATVDDRREDDACFIVRDNNGQGAPAGPFFQQFPRRWLLGRCSGMCAAGCQKSNRLGISMPLATATKIIARHC